MDEVEVEVKIGVRVRVASGWVGLGSLAVVEVEGEDAYEFIWSSGGRQWVGMRMEGFWGGFAGFRLDFSKHKKKQANDRSQRGLPWGGGRLLKSEREWVEGPRRGRIRVDDVSAGSRRGEDGIVGGRRFKERPCFAELRPRPTAHHKGILPDWGSWAGSTNPWRHAMRWHPTAKRSQPKPQRAKAPLN